MNGAAHGTSRITEGASMDRFLTPEAMLTPGAAGGITMLIANALANNFHLTPSYIGLGLSFLFGLLVMASVRRWWLQIVYYVLNSLIMFCVAFGSGNLVAPPGSFVTTSGSKQSVNFLTIFTTGHADENGNGALQILQKQYEDLDAGYNKAAAILAALQKSKAPQSDIDKQNALIQDLQREKDANLKLQANMIAKLQHSIGVSNDAAKIAHDPNISGGSSSFFRPWTNPFHW